VIQTPTEALRTISVNHDDFEGQNLWCGIKVRIPDDAVVEIVQTLY